MSVSCGGISVPSDSDLAKQPRSKMKNRRFSLQSPKTWSNLLFRVRKNSSSKFGSEVNLSQSPRPRSESYDTAKLRKRAESLQHLPSGQSRITAPDLFDPFARFTEFLGREVPPNSPDYGPSPAYGSQNSLNLEELPIPEREVEYCPGLPTLSPKEQVQSQANSAGTPEINSKTSPAKLRINQFFRPRSYSENKKPSLSHFLNKRRSSVAGTSTSSTGAPTSVPTVVVTPSTKEKTESPSKSFRKISLIPKFRSRSKSESRKSSTESPEKSSDNVKGMDYLQLPEALPNIPPVVTPPVAPQKQNVVRKSIYRQRSKSESRSSNQTKGENETSNASKRRRSVGFDSQTKQDVEEVQKRYPQRRQKVAPPVVPSTKLNPTPITLQVLPEGVQVNHESPSTLPPESAVPTMPTVMELALSAIVVNVEPIVRRRSASIALGTQEPDPNLFASAQEFKSFRSRLENVRKTARSALRRNESKTDPFSSFLTADTTLPQEKVEILTPRRRDSIRPRSRKSFSGDRATTVNFDRTKSRSVDQSLTAALDADVFSRFGSSNTSVSNNSRDEDETHAGPRPATPTGDRRSSGSGSALKLPPEDTTMYTVQASDTLTSLAARFDITPSELAALNRLSSRLLFPGQVLYVPRKKDGSTEDVAVAVGGRCTPTSPMSQSIEKELSLVVGTPPKETPQESAVLENIRAPGSPRICRRDPLASVWSSTQSGGQNSSTEVEQHPSTEVPLTLEEERIQDREAYDKFLKINVRHITDGQGVVAGVLLVTPNALMFDPNVSDPLVIENGPERYGVIAPLECVASAGLYPDIAHMRLSDVSPNKSLEVNKPDLYYPLECPLYKKYVLGAQAREVDPPKLETPSGSEKPSETQESLDQVALQLSEAINDESHPTTADDESHLDPFGEAPHPQSQEPQTFHSPNRVSALSRQLSETTNPLLENSNVARPPSPREIALFTLEEPGESKDTLSPVPGTSPNLATIIECVPETKPEDQEHVIRLEVKMNDADKEASSSPWASSHSASPNSSSRHLGVDDTPPANHSASSASSVEKMDPNEFKPRDPFSIPLIAPKANNQQSAGEPPSAAKKENNIVDKEGTFTRSLEEKVAGNTDPIVIGNQARARHTSAGGNRSGGNALRGSRFVPGGSSDNNSQEGTPPSASSPESRGQKMLKRLSYPLVWMGESFSSDKDPSTQQTEQTPSESMFSRVFSSSPRSFVDFSSGLFSRAPEEVAKVRDLKEYGATAKVLSDAGVRRASNTNEITARPGRAVPKVSPSTAIVSNKMGYRSMVSVEDVPELFASFDKLIPKPAQACEDPPLYLRIRMGKPLNKKISHSTPLMSYGKKKMRPEYWFSIPRDRADHLFRFFLLWTPNVYGEIDATQAAERGFLLIEEDTELWDEPAETQVRSKLVRKIRPKKEGMKNKDGEDDETEDDERGNDLGDIAKESWEIVSMNVYGSSLSSLELDNYLPELIGHSDILTDECRRQLAKRLPARAEGYPWTLVFSTAQHGFSLNSMYRKMAKVNSPILLVIEDTQGHVFGALTSCELRVSELFYGTGESYLFAFTPELKVFGWTGENTYFVKGNNESIAIGAGDGKFGLWLDGDLYQGRTQPCKTFGNDPLTPDEDFLVRALECWAFL